MDFFNKLADFIALQDKSFTELKLNFDDGHVILDKNGNPVKDLKNTELTKFVAAQS